MKRRVIIAATAAMVALAGGKAAAQNETQVASEAAAQNETQSASGSAARSVRQTPDGVAGLDRLTVRVTGIGYERGTVMVALGDYTDVSNMVAAKLPTDEAKEGAVECTLEGKIDLAATLYAFLDTNDNRNLDLGESGIPVEKCAYGPVVLDENGAATIELKYYNN